MAHTIHIVPLLAALLLAACAPNPAMFETAPVVINATAGPVTCQLYTTDLVVWDRSIDRPPTMPVAEADAICQAAGMRQAEQAALARAAAAAAPADP
ncbi:MAG: hypothetical protein MUF73_10595 [Rhodobacteraceae bacterium]|jgi:hypothetical protein|nr:hypothetical protein [Paracoccaceae bacterium]